MSECDSNGFRPSAHRATMIRLFGRASTCARRLFNGSSFSDALSCLSNSTASELEQAEETTGLRAAEATSLSRFLALVSADGSVEEHIIATAASASDCANKANYLLRAFQECDIHSHDEFSFVLSSAMKGFPPPLAFLGQVPAINHVFHGKRKNGRILSFAEEDHGNFAGITNTTNSSSSRGVLRAVDPSTTANTGLEVTVPYPLAPHDPAAVVTLNSHTQQLHLSPVQRELAWAARRRQYQEVLVRLVACFQSHLAPIEKCHTLLALHEEVIAKRLRLRADTYEDFFHVFYAVATLGDAAPALSVEEENGRVFTSSSLMPYEFASANMASLSLLTDAMLQNIWSAYRYMIDSGTNPTARVVQHVMGILGRFRNRRDATVEAKAHALMMDLDRFHLIPTEYTIASYIGVCDVHGVMHLAVARVTDYRSRHERQASPGIYARLIFGLLHNQQYDEALACVAALDSAALTSHLLNAVLNAARHSRDPLAAFALYRSVSGRGIRPTPHTVSTLLESMRMAGRYDELDFLIQEMRRYRVRVDGPVLNRLLGALLHLKRGKDAKALVVEMDRKGVVVFDELRQQLPAR